MRTIGQFNELHRYNEQKRREANHAASAKIAAVCAFVVVAYLVAAFFQQAFQQVMK